jgi:hypothetical protein
MAEILSLGVVTKLFDEDSAAAPVNSTAFAIQSGDKAKVITWRTSFASAPSACSIKLQQSLNGVDFSDLDTSTATAGETRTTGVTATMFLRARKESQTGGGALTLEVNVGV